MTENKSLPKVEQFTVCGGRMEDPALNPSAIFDGKTVYFCHIGCLRAFESNPQAFMAGGMDHPDTDTN
jgi:YHS domain-containing protein